MANLAYLGTKSTGDATIGGILVVDELALPAEFKHTEPVAPKGLTALLHGRKLDLHVKLNVIALPLLSAVASPVTAVVCDESLLLKLQPKAKHPLIMLAETAGQPESEIGALEEIGDSRWLAIVSATSSPVTITLAPGQDGKVKKIVDLLIEIAESVSVLEPMERLGKALEYVTKHGAGEG